MIGNTINLVLIGGFPYAGTRQFTDFLNGVEGFDIRGEVYAQSFDALVSMFEHADRNHHGKWTETRYRQYRPQAVLNAIGGICKGGNGPFDFKHTGYFGFKNPVLEAYKERLDILFRADHGGIDFFYCMRSLTQNLLSGMHRFGLTVPKYEGMICKSVDALDVMLRDDFYRIHFLCLDDFVSADDRTDWLARNLFGKVSGLDMPDLQGLVERVGNRNSSVNRTGTSKPTNLSEGDRAQTFGSIPLAKAYNRLHELSGFDLYF